MTTLADIGFGTLFQSGAGNSPETFTTFAEVTNITPPNISRDSIDASHEQSPDAWREFIAGLKDGGEVTIEFNFLPGQSSTTTMLAEFDLAGPSATKTRRIQFYRSGVVIANWEFEGFLTGFEPEAPLDDKMTASATFKVSGKPVLTVVP